MKKSFKVSIILFALILTFLCDNINAQIKSIENIEMENSIYHYCTIINYRCYFGSNNQLYQEEEKALKNINESGPNRLTEELNIMSKYGWDFVIAYSAQDFNNSTPYMVRIYRKKVNINIISSEND